jgi:hypothetical protein
MFSVRLAVTLTDSWMMKEYKLMVLATVDLGLPLKVPTGPLFCHRNQFQTGSIASGIDPQTSHVDKVHNDEFSLQLFLLRIVK